jgi:uncharacterized protein (DUF2132 family)
MTDGTETPPSAPQKNNPLHGVTLEVMVEDLVAFFGWEELGARIRIRCFNEDPSVPSSLKFLRKTAWATEASCGTAIAVSKSPFCSLTFARIKRDVSAWLDVAPRHVAYILAMWLPSAG